MSGFNDILKFQVDESPLVYHATVVSDDSQFDLSTALFHVISETCYAVHINASSLTKVYIATNNIHVEIIRFSKN